jgi:hypothetical protein
MKNLKQFLSFVLSLAFVLQGMPVHADVQSALEANLVKNYVTNGAFESGAARWSAYKNSASPLPVTGAGGSPSTAITSSTSTPIAGKASGLITHNAANLQGEGISVGFAVDSAAKGRVLTISGLYQIVSGTYSGGTAATDSDYEVYVYDVDAGAIIQPAGYKMDGGVAGINYPINATFQTSTTSTNYRLVFHNATTTASAFQLKLDSVSVSVNSRSQGAPITDRVQFPMVISATTSAPTKGGSISQDLAYWRRIGDSMEITYSYRQSSAGTAGSGIYLFKLPSGYAIDLTKTPGATNTPRTVVGAAEGTPGAVETQTGTVSVYDATSLSIWATNSTATNQQVSSTYASLTNANTEYSFTAIVPIVGWSSAVTMSDSSDTRVVAARAYLASGGTTTSGAYTKLLFNGVTTDTHGAFSITNSNYVVPVSGVYRVVVNTSWLTNPTAGGQEQLQIFKNGVQDSQLFRNDNASVATLAGTAEINCIAGDILDIRYFFSSAGSPAFGTGTGTSYVSFSRLSGPSQIAATESVNARYSNTAGTSLPTGTTNLPFATRAYDSHIAFNGTAYICPVSGKYRFGATIGTASTTLSTSQSLQIILLLNGVQVGFVIVNGNGASAQYYFQNYTETNCNSGDSLTVQVFNGGAATSLNTTANTTVLTVSRIGN